MPSTTAEPRQDLERDTSVRVQHAGMTTTPPRQLRLIIETSDFDQAARFYRDVLGMPEQPAFATVGEDRVSILHAGTATIELATSKHVQNIDEIEGAPPSAETRLRLALEVDDTESAVQAAEQAGATVLAFPTETPFRSLNARVQGPDGWQVTFF
jgi:methylmalonyl-CoA/ethylmalonyl-CoA epimerase